jgi:hypothetical protein
MNKKLRVWWIPQIPGKAFHYDVDTVHQGVLLMDTLAKYDLFQFQNNIKPDYCNAGGIQQWCEEDQDWEDWYDEHTGEDNPERFTKELQKQCI